MLVGLCSILPFIGIKTYPHEQVKSLMDLQNLLNQEEVATIQALKTNSSSTKMLYVDSG